MFLTVCLLVIQACCMFVMKIWDVSYDYDSFTLIFILLAIVSIVVELPAIVKDRNLYIVFLVSLCFRLGLLFCDYYVIRIMHSGLDTERFFWVAAEAAQSGIGGTLETYYKWLAYLFALVGPARLYAQYINFICGLFTCLVMLKSFRLLGLSATAQKIGFVLLCLLPNWVDMSVILIRESLISLFLAVSLLAFITWYQKRRKRYILYAVIFMVPAVDLHSGMVFFPIAIITGYLMYNAKKRKIRLNIVSLTLLCGTLVTIIALITHFGLGYIGRIQLASITNISSYAVSGDIYAGSTYLNNLSSNTWMDVLFHTPIRLLYFLFSPLPVDFRGVSDLIAFVASSVPLLIIVCHASYTLKTCKKNKVLLTFLLLALVFGGVVYAWGTFAAGTAMRHRDKLVPLYVLIMVVSLDARVNIKLYKTLPFTAANLLENFSK